MTYRKPLENILHSIYSKIQMDLLKLSIPHKATGTCGFFSHRNRSQEIKHLMANVSLNNQASFHGCEYLVGILQAGFSLVELYSCLTSAFASMSTSPSKFNITSTVTQMQTQTSGLNPFSASTFALLLTQW